MLQESLLNSSDLNSPKHGFAVDHDMTISNLGRAQAYFIEHHCGKFGSDGKAKEDISYYDSLSDSFYFCAQGMELSHSVCIEDVAFQKMFFGILSANNLLVVSGTHRLTANKPAMLEGMYKAYDECFGPRRTYLKKQSDLKLQHEDNSKNSMLKRLKENNALESLTLIDDEPEFGENLEPMNEMGINFQLVKPPRSSDFENACDSEAKRYWLTPAARATRNQYMFDVLERELALGHMTLPGLKKSLDSLALAEGNSLALIVFNEFYQEKNTRELQRLCEADERLAMLTYSTRVGSISPLLMIPVYLLGAKMTVPSVAAPYLATISIKTTAAMVGLVLGAITLAIANLAATAYLFKNSYNKTAATVGLLNAVGTGLIIFGSANLWNPIGWVTLGLAALVAVVGCIHAKSNKPAISNENTSRAKGGRALGGSPYSSFSRSSSVLDFNSISSTASTVSPASASPATSFDSHNSGADLKSVVAERKVEQVSKQGGGITEAWVQKLRAERNVKDRQKWLEELYLNPAEYMYKKDAVDAYFQSRRWKGVNEAAWADWYDFDQYQSSVHRRETEALFKKMEWKIPEISCDKDSQLMHKEFMKRMSAKPKEPAESIDWPWSAPSSASHNFDSGGDRAFASLLANCR